MKPASRSVKGRRIAEALVCASLLHGSAAAADANLLSNGGFETPGIPAATFLSFGPGHEPAGFAWSVTAATVDVISKNFFPWTSPTADGVQNLDLVGGGTDGAIAQSFVTTPGQPYLLTFQYANNPGAGVPRPVSASVTITDGALTLLDQSFSHGTSTGSDFHWTPYIASFTATGSSATLAFDETVGGAAGGIFLDAVSVTALPEPSTQDLLAFSVISLCAFYRFAGRSVQRASASS